MTSAVGGAPFTKLLVYTTLGLLVVNRLLSATKPRRSSPLLSAIAPGLSHMFTYATTGEYILAALILHQLRVIEIACGPAKYGGLVLCCASLGYGLEAIMSRVFFTSSASGLHPVVFASLVGYYLDVPRQSSFSLFGAWELSDKSFLYGMAGHMALVHGWKSLVGAASGAISGFLYFVFLQPLQRVSVPGWVDALN